MMMMVMAVVLIGDDDGGDDDWWWWLMIGDDDNDDDLCVSQNAHFGKTTTFHNQENSWFYRESITILWLSDISEQININTKPRTIPDYIAHY